MIGDSRALTDAQLTDYLAAAERSDDDRDRLAAVVFPTTGLRAGEFCHMTRDWLDLDRDWLVVPRVQDCTCDECRERFDAVFRDEPAYRAINERYLAAQAAVTDAKSDAITVATLADAERELPELLQDRAVLKTMLDHNTYAELTDRVGDDRTEEIQEAFDGLWWPRNPEGYRYIPLVEPATRAVLIDWFDTHETVDIDRQSLRDRTGRVAERAGIDQPVRPGTLRRTFLRRLFDAGFTIEEIRAVTGDSDYAFIREQLQYRSRHVDRAFETKWGAL